MPALTGNPITGQLPLAGSCPKTSTRPPRVTRATWSALANETSTAASGSSAMSSGVCPALKLKWATMRGWLTGAVTASTAPLPATGATAAAAAATIVLPYRRIIGTPFLLSLEHPSRLECLHRGATPSGHRSWKGGDRGVPVDVVAVELPAGFAVGDEPDEDRQHDRHHHVPQDAGGAG